MFTNRSFCRPKGLITQHNNQRHYAAALQVIAAVGLFLAPGAPDTQAAFELNFQPLTSGASYQSFGDNDETAAFSCNMSFQSDQNCRQDDQEIGRENNWADDSTPMYQRLFRSTAGDATNGKYYWHVIIGDYQNQANNPLNTTGFYQEYIIEANSGRRMDDSISTSLSASATWTSSNTAENIGGITVYDTGTNGGTTTSGQGNPTRVIMRQIVEDGETRSTFLKDEFDKKPLIVQTVVDYKITDPDTNVDNKFTIDMRALTYDSADNTGIYVENITNLSGGAEAANQGDYDTTDATYTPHFFNQEETTVSGGKFTWTAGSGQLGADGTYTYYSADGSLNPSGFQPTDRNYSGFCDPSQNVNWSGSGACKNPGGGGDGWGRFGWD